MLRIRKSKSFWVSFALIHSFESFQNKKERINAHLAPEHGAISNPYLVTQQPRVINVSFLPFLPSSTSYPCLPKTATTAEGGGEVDINCSKPWVDTNRVKKKDSLIDKKCLKVGINRKQSLGFFSLIKSEKKIGVGWLKLEKGKALARNTGRSLNYFVLENKYSCVFYFKGFLKRLQMRISCITSLPLENLSRFLPTEPKSVFHNLMKDSFISFGFPSKWYAAIINAAYRLIWTNPGA